MITKKEARAIVLSELYKSGRLTATANKAIREGKLSAPVIAELKDYYKLRDCAQKLGSLGGLSKAGYKPPRKTKAVTRCAKRLAIAPTKKRRRNPISSRASKVSQAMKLFMRFREEEPKFVDEISVDWPTVGMVIGKCDGILYSTSRAGKKEYYKHEFTGASCPTLCASFDGKQIFIVGGHYDFTEDGITDRR